VSESEKNAVNFPLISSTWSAEELDAISRVVESDRYSMGDNVRAFEQRFAEMFGAKYAICVNSGSSANMVALAALFFSKNLKRGDEVLVPAVGWSTTYAPLFFLGLKPIFVDIEPRTFNMSIEEIERNISPRTRAILTVNLLGKSCDYDSLGKICEKHDLLLIEDNCEAMGAQIGEKYCGTFGLAGTFSFYFSHHIVTIEGGMITTDDELFYNFCRSVRSHGWVRDLDSEKLDIRYPFKDDFRKMFWFVVPGFNVRPTEFTGAIGLEQLKKFPEMLEVRRRNFQHFNEKMKSSRALCTQEADIGHAAFSLPFVLKPDMCERVNMHSLRKMFVENQIEIRPIASGDITKHPFMDYFDLEHLEEYENAAYLDRYGFMIGNHSIDLRDKIDRVFRLLYAWEEENL
jgi:CDP-6-deoxy-D-xylo-4-hexulose-3-dehydrase